MSVKEARDAAKDLFSLTPNCYGHCKEKGSFEFQGDSMIIQVCPDRYVSRIVTYGPKVDQYQFKETLRRLASGLETVQSGDIRVASRYAWDLGLKRKSDDLIVRLAYWTQSYRSTKDERVDRPALFLCSNNDSFFMQPLNSRNRLCKNCTA